MTLEAIEARLRAHAAAYPETVEDHPWGESAFKVRGKTFLFLSRGEGGLSFSVKLPASRDFALVFDCAAPTGYGLGKSGWVTVRLADGSELDPDLAEGWIGESFRAVAPKKLAAALAG